MQQCQLIVNQGQYFGICHFLLLDFFAIVNAMKKIGKPSVKCQKLGQTAIFRSLLHTLISHREYQHLTDPPKMGDPSFIGQFEHCYHHQRHSGKFQSLDSKQLRYLNIVITIIILESLVLRAVRSTHFESQSAGKVMIKRIHANIQF